MDTVLFVTIHWLTSVRHDANVSCCVRVPVSDGLYLEHKGVGIAQYMFATFLPSQSCRKYLKLRKQQNVDFRAACFCHKRVVDIAYV